MARGDGVGGHEIEKASYATNKDGTAKKPKRVVAKLPGLPPTPMASDYCTPQTPCGCCEECRKRAALFVCAEAHEGEWDTGIVPRPCPTCGHAKEAQESTEEKVPLVDVLRMLGLAPEAPVPVPREVTPEERTARLRGLKNQSSSEDTAAPTTTPTTTPATKSNGPKAGQSDRSKGRVATRRSARNVGNVSKQNNVRKDTA